MNATKTTKPATSCAHSNGKPGVPALMTKINVRFAPVLPLQFQIKHPMKSALIQNKPAVYEAAPPLGRTPFADLMLHPEKLEAALKAAKSENDAFSASRIFGRSHADHAATNGSSKDQGTHESSSHSPDELKTTQEYEN